MYGYNLWPMAILAVLGAVLGVYEAIRVAIWIAHHMHLSFS